MKIITITLTFLIYTILTLATPIEEFAKKVDTSTLIHSYLSMESFKNFESNESIKEITENFKVLIPLYISAKDLFSKEEIQFFNIERPFVQVDPTKEVYTTTIERSAITYMDFFTILNIYLEYLKTHPSIKNNELHHTLSAKALYDLTQLMHNSSNTLEYIISLGLLKNLYNNIDDYSLLKKYPPLKKETLLTRLRQDKDESLALFKTSIQSVFDDNRTTKLSINLMKECFRHSQQKMDILYENLIEAINDGSPKAIQDYKNYKKTIKYDLSKWQQIQLQFSRTILDALHYLNLDIGYYFGLPERAAKLMTSVALSDIDPMLKFWKDNEALMKQYNKLLNSKEHFHR